MCAEEPPRCHLRRLNADSRVQAAPTPLHTSRRSPRHPCPSRSPSGGTRCPGDAPSGARRRLVPRALMNTEQVCSILRGSREHVQPSRLRVSGSPLRCRLRLRLSWRRRLRCRLRFRNRLRWRVQGRGGQCCRQLGDLLLRRGRRRLVQSRPARHLPTGRRALGRPATHHPASTALMRVPIGSLNAYLCADA